MAEKFPDFPIPMACHSATVELRGQRDVSDKLAAMDAHALCRFLVGRGYISWCLSLPSVYAPLKLLRDATQLAAVDTVQVSCAGIVTWKVCLGDQVQKDQTIGKSVMYLALLCWCK